MGLCRYGTYQTESKPFFNQPTEQDFEIIQDFISGEENQCDKQYDIYEIALNPKKFRSGFIDKDKIYEFLKNIRPSSITCERAFSVCSRIQIPIRGRLGTKHFNNILFINQNRRNVF